MLFTFKIATILRIFTENRVNSQKLRLEKIILGNRNANIGPQKVIGDREFVTDSTLKLVTLQLARVKFAPFSY